MVKQSVLASGCAGIGILFCPKDAVDFIKGRGTARSVPAAPSKMIISNFFCRECSMVTQEPDVDPAG